MKSTEILNSEEVACAKRSISNHVIHSDSDRPALCILNSLTRKKELFKPIDGNKVKMYICGPTVYDSAHMGHARAYLSFDILRRVLTNFFRYNVVYVMNITDIDDKIIKRARQNFLYDKYVGSTNNDFKRVSEDVIVALELFRKRVEVEVDADKQKLLYEMTSKVDTCIASIEKSLEDKKKQSPVESLPKLEAEKLFLLSAAKDILAEWLDSTEGHTVNDHSVFSSLAQKFESDFFLDMEHLNVMKPTVLTRVSQYIPEIIAFIQRIIKNGYAYETKSGSVYFDTLLFESKPHHSYAKLLPEAFGDAQCAAKNMREGEGELSITDDKLQEKRNASDFALWKSSKSGEPFWDSPWGKGRPGWHIECSAMSCSVLGKNLDIHAGGLDLKFPHHDNEIAQCEAYFDSSPWVNYFLHCGTLRIAGSKMSKSLKNFITIKAALKQYTARQIRILFLMHNWSDVLDYSPATMEHVLHFEKTWNEFVLTVKDICRKEPPSFPRAGDREMQLLEQFTQFQQNVYAALCNSIDTKTVIEKIRELISTCNVYIKDIEAERKPADGELLKEITAYISNLLDIFGVPECKNDKNGNVVENHEELKMPFVNVIADLRQLARNFAIETKNKEILKELDKIRDDVLPELGVRLEDKADGTRVKLVDREELLREKEQKLQAAREEAERKEKLKQEAAANKERKRLEKEQKKNKDAAKKKQTTPPNNTPTQNTYTSSKTTS